MTLLSTSELAQIAKVEKRQIQRILEKGVPDLGAKRTPGGHWVIPDSPAVRKWAKNHERWKRGGCAKKHGLNQSHDLDKSRAIITIEGISQSFAIWHRNMAQSIESWDATKLDRAIGLLADQARVHAELVAKRAALKARK